MTLVKCCHVHCEFNKKGICMKGEIKIINGYDDAENTCDVFEWEHLED